MAEVLLGNLDRHTARDGMTGVRVPHPVRAGLCEPLRALCVALPSQRSGAVFKEALDLVVERRCGDPLPRVDRLPGVGVIVLFVQISAPHKLKAISDKHLRKCRFPATPLSASL